MKQNIPVDVWRHIFSLKLKDDPLFIFDFTREIIILGDYMKNEIREMVKNAIIRNFELTKVSFFNYCLGNNKEYILKSKIFLNNIEVLNSIDDSFLFLYNIYNSNFLEYITIKNNMILIEWLINKKKNLDLCRLAIRYNNLKMLRFLRERNDPYHWNKNCTYYAFKNNNLEMLSFLRSGNDPCPWDRYCCWKAVENNNLEMLQFLRKGNDPCPWYELCTCDAVKNNNLEILKFLREGNDPCPWNDNCCWKAVENNNLEMLQFLRKGNDPCPWHELCTWYAVKNNNLKMLKFLREGNDPCPWDKNECLQICIENNNLEMLKFINSQND
jgi:hypothetical protein